SKSSMRTPGSITPCAFLKPAAAAALATAGGKLVIFGPALAAWAIIWIDNLPAEQKAVVVLKIWEEMTFAEIAEVLEISANTAASRYRYALDKLRDELRPLHRDLP
ncbi:MAG TPA: sigma-70 family RNA polymerase sigma factor, partial [Candidatus Methylacidiphilales bacterium]